MMADTTKIEWTDSTWNPIRGCSRVSEGCRHCYAEGVAARFSGTGLPYEGLAKHVTLPGGGKEARWTGRVAFAGENILTLPLRWRRPRRIFVNSMSDLFHEAVPDAWIDQIFAVMALSPQHTFQVLTKRPERMRAYMLGSDDVWCRWWRRADQVAADVGLSETHSAADYLRDGEGAAIGPLPNVWLGVSCEDQAAADERIPLLLGTPAAVRFVSCEPLLGPIDLTGFLPDWVIAGGESGPHARPSHPDWFRSLRDQCAAADVPFLFKQWGEYQPQFPQYADEFGLADEDMTCSGRDFPAEGVLYRDGYFYDGVTHQPHTGAGAYWIERIGKKAAGRTLDGVIHDAMPGVK